MRAEGYLMDATLDDGLLTVEGRGRAGRLALDWDMRDRMEALQERMAQEERVAVAEGQGGLGDARTREQIQRALADTRRALADKTTPRIPVAIIDRVEFSDANPVKNGRITVHVGEKKAIFHFRRKTRDQARELYEELMRQMDTR